MAIIASHRGGWQSRPIKQEAQTEQKTSLGVREVGRGINETRVSCESIIV